uniref:Uncharacterized protein n=1 Tax=Knufia peltigerae TaxID=1002370 RepID=A0AA38XUI8_9EURO|nr:hypothetical protein H2204_011407 [Knufia peltigerae]
MNFGFEVAPLICAEPASTGCVDEWKWTIPVLALVFGFAMRWMQEHASNRKQERSQRLLRRELRCDQARVQRSDAERANLIGIQEAAARYYSAASEAHSAMLDGLGSQGVWSTARIARESSRAIQTSRVDMAVLQYRIHASAVCMQLDQLIDDVTSALDAESLEVAEDHWRRADMTFSQMQRLIGSEIRLLAITDVPEPEVAAAGHDRTIINIKPEHVDAWLNPDPADLAALYRIFDDKRHPFYEHQLAA